MNEQIMKLQAGPFDEIKKGNKIIESRLYDEKRQLIRLGDIITFKRKPELTESVKAEVIELLNYPTFYDLMSAFPASDFGGISKEGLLEEIHEFYPEEKEAEHTVLGIKIRLV